MWLCFVVVSQATLDGTGNGSKVTKNPTLLSPSWNQKIRLCYFPRISQKRKMCFSIILEIKHQLSDQSLWISLGKYMCFVTRRKTTHFKNKLIKIVQKNITFQNISPANKGLSLKKYSMLLFIQLGTRRIWKNSYTLQCCTRFIQNSNG